MPAPPSSATLRRVRTLVWALALIAVGYLFLRFDNLTLPPGCSPLLRFSPGNRLLLDRRAGPLEVGDAAVFRGSDGTLLLGKVDRIEPGRRYWLVTDAPDCPGQASPELGWIEHDAIAARILFAWPF